MKSVSTEKSFITTVTAQYRVRPIYRENKEKKRGASVGYCGF
jgi:hypothetical protein